VDSPVRDHFNLEHTIHAARAVLDILCILAELFLSPIAHAVNMAKRDLVASCRGAVLPACPAFYPQLPATTIDRSPVWHSDRFVNIETLSAHEVRGRGTQLLGTTACLFCDAKPRRRSCSRHINSNRLENPASDAMDYGTSRFCEKNVNPLHRFAPCNIEVDADAELHP
jgi:hypothetical protein